MANPKMTPEEKARADGYAAGVLAERDHTSRALAEVERLTRERDTALRFAKQADTNLGNATRGAARLSAERDAARAELKKLEDALLAREMTYCVRGNDLWDLGFVSQEDRNKERWRADQAEAALRDERNARDSALEEAALVLESDRCPEGASITKVWWIYGAKIAAWLRGRKRS